MAKAFVTTKDGKQVVIAESDDTVFIEGNQYFPPSAVKQEYMTDSPSHTTCPWKGLASYKTVKVGDEEWPDGAWYYPEPIPSSLDIVGKDFTNYFAFWRGVEVEA